MVRFTRARRELLAERFGELANFAVAGLVFGQAVGQETFSPGVAVAGMGSVAGVIRIRFCAQGRPSMTTALFMLGGICVIAGIITLFDWLARRKDRQSHRRPAA